MIAFAQHSKCVRECCGGGGGGASAAVLCMIERINHNPFHMNMLVLE